MGYFFRRSARLGPFRLNFSKSGIGASVGVKGARLTMTPRGTTYVTVGSHGFYYRETLSNRGGSPVQSDPPNYVPPPQSGSAVNAIPSASASGLVDSSGERLIQQLNERASMFNPAWLLYVGSMIALGALSLLPTAPAMPTPPNLPDVTSPFSSERSSNTIDEYSMLTARYGEPDSLLLNDGPIPMGTARYGAVHLDVVFVPNGCVPAYEEVMKARADRFKYTSSAKSKTKGVKQCVPRANAGWTTIRYVNSAGNDDISTDIATPRLDRDHHKTDFTPDFGKSRFTENTSPNEIRDALRQSVACGSGADEAGF